MLFPVTSFVCEVLPEGQRESSRTELFYEDLDRLPPDEVARICEWITEKIDGFSAKLKPEAKDAEAEVRFVPRNTKEPRSGHVCCLCCVRGRPRLKSGSGNQRVNGGAWASACRAVPHLRAF